MKKTATNKRVRAGQWLAVPAGAKKVRVTRAGRIEVLAPAPKRQHRRRTKKNAARKPRRKTDKRSNPRRRNATVWSKGTVWKRKATRKNAARRRNAPAGPYSGSWDYTRRELTQEARQAVRGRGRYAGYDVRVDNSGRTTLIAYYRAKGSTKKQSVNIAI